MVLIDLVLDNDNGLAIAFRAVALLPPVDRLYTFALANVMLNKPYMLACWPMHRIVRLGLGGHMLKGFGHSFGTSMELVECLEQRACARSKPQPFDPLSGRVR